MRAPHYPAFMQSLPALSFIEVHSENHFGLGGLPYAVLIELREHYPLALHGVGLSLGSAGALALDHLERLRALVERVEPALVSEHLSWSARQGQYLHDLLPMPFTEESIEVLVSHIVQVQDALRRPLLVENVSSYVRFADDQMPESIFVREICQRAGCQLLLDITNLYINANNHSFDALSYLADLAPASIGQLHLSGHQARVIEQASGAPELVLLDTHDSAISAPVWQLYGEALKRFGARPTLIEWDSQLPSLDALLCEAGQAQRRINAGARA